MAFVRNQFAQAPRSRLGATSTCTAALVLSALLAASACSGGPEGTRALDAGNSQLTAAQGGGNAGGNAGASGAPSMNSPAPLPVPCGPTQCVPHDSPLSGLIGDVTGPNASLLRSVPCCLDEASGRCGTAAASGGKCEPPAVADARCPGLDVTAAGALGGLLGNSVTVGCCVDGACGLDGAIFGRGCVENSEARTALSAIPLIANVVRVPSSQLCMRPDDLDAGSEDAGR